LKEGWDGVALGHFTFNEVSLPFWHPVLKGFAYLSFLAVAHVYLFLLLHKPCPPKFISSACDLSSWTPMHKTQLHILW
jgi:hypothetical protein